MRLASLLFLPIVLSAQPAGVNTNVPPAAPAGNAQPAPIRPEDKCRVDGKVVSSSTSEPVRKATILLRRADLNPSTTGMPATYTTTSDAAGAFSMHDLDPGKYRLTVTRTGYVTAEYGARGALRSGTTLTLDPGQHVADVNFKLTPHGVITGRVLDEDGDPLANVAVQVLRYRYIQGRKQLLPLNGASTNDLGEYRIFGIPPGSCLLSATYRSSGMFEAALDRSSAAQPDEEYVPTYYPGATDAAGAAAVDLLPGAHLEGLDFRLSRTRTVRVRGVVRNSAAAGRQNISVMLVPANRYGYFSNTNRTIVRDPDGHFELRGVAPGAYNIVASLYDGDKSQSARTSLDVGSTTIENVVLTLAPGQDLNGRIRVEGQSSVRLGDIRLNLQPYDPSGINFFPTSMGRVQDDGAFTFHNAGPERYRLAAYNLPDGCYLKSVRFGSEDALEAPLDLTSGAAGTVEVVLGVNAGQVQGTVTNPKQEPAAGATVVLIPQSARRREYAGFYKNVTSDQYGHFLIKNVDPGEYKAYAWEDMEPGAYMDPDFLKPVGSRGQDVSIHENSREQLQLDLIPSEAGSRQPASQQ